MVIFASFAPLVGFTNVIVGSEIIAVLCVAALFGILAFLMHSLTDTNLQSLLLVNWLWLSMGWVWAAKRLSVSA